jgi:hypothetical protein
MKSVFERERPAKREEKGKKWWHKYKNRFLCPHFFLPFLLPGKAIDRRMIDRGMGRRQCLALIPLSIIPLSNSFPK